MNKLSYYIGAQVLKLGIICSCWIGLTSINEASKTLVFQTYKHDFGEIPFDGVYPYDFSYKNAATTPIIIDNVRTTCGCTAPTWSEEPIAPNETGVLNIEFTPRTVGAFEKKIKIYLHRIKKPILLTITGEVI